jgi:hypothetical protein
MGYYTIRLDPDASRICTIIFPWGKYSYEITDGFCRFSRHISILLEVYLIKSGDH